MWHQFSPIGLPSIVNHQALHEATFANVPGWSLMCSPPDAVAIHQMVARLVDAKKVVEVGVFTGYTALGFALALPKHGKLVACDVNEKWASIGRVCTSCFGLQSHSPPQASHFGSKQALITKLISASALQQTPCKPSSSACQ